MNRELKINKKEYEFLVDTLDPIFKRFLCTCATLELNTSRIMMRGIITEFLTIVNQASIPHDIIKILESLKTMVGSLKALEAVMGEHQAKYEKGEIP
jgi:hypothetical protein